jgi:hypothetical protein
LYFKKKRYFMTLKELEKRIRVLEDIEEVKKLHLTYINALIVCDWDKVEECFAENGVVDFKESGILKGKRAISRDFRERIAQSHIGKEGILSVHPIISVEGDRAKGSWTFYHFTYHPREYADFPAEKAPDWVQGLYDMEYKRVDGKWKISLLKWRARLISKK